MIYSALLITIFLIKWLSDYQLGKVGRPEFFGKYYLWLVVFIIAVYYLLYLITFQKPSNPYIVVLYVIIIVSYYLCVLNEIKKFK